MLQTLRETCAKMMQLKDKRFVPSLQIRRTAIAAVAKFLYNEMKLARILKAG